MPSLPPEYRKKLLGYTPQKCGSCAHQVYKDYCRQCDEFLFLCSEGCPQNSTDHEGHRRYPKEERLAGDAEATEHELPGLLGMLVDVHSAEPDPADHKTLEELFQSALVPSERGYSLRSIFRAIYNLGRQRGRNDQLQS